MTDRDSLVKRLCVAVLVVYVLLFAFNSFTRTREFADADTTNFVDVARHIASGQGVTQSALGMNQPHFDVDDPFPHRCPPSRRSIRWWSRQSARPACLSRIRLCSFPWSVTPS